MADVAYAFHFQPSELYALDVVDLMFWHGQIDRINRLLNAG